MTSRGEPLKSRRRHTVAVVIAHGQSPFEFAVACEVFGIDRSDLFKVPWYRFLVCTADPPPVVAQTGFTIDTPYRLDALRRADTIVVPASGRVTEPATRGYPSTMVPGPLMSEASFR